MTEDIPKWAQQLISDVGQLKDQVLTNCAKLDDMKDNTDLIPQVLEIVQANGNNHEELSKRVDTIEDKFVDMDNIAQKSSLSLG